jgi:hypothetical protein
MATIDIARKAEVFLKAVEPLSVKEAIRAHAAAKRGYVARGEKEGDSGEMFDTLAQLAEAPCADDAELIEKMRYLIIEECAIWGRPDQKGEFGSTLRALEFHLS